MHHLRNIFQLKRRIVVKKKIYRQCVSVFWRFYIRNTFTVKTHVIRNMRDVSGSSTSEHLIILAFWNPLKLLFYVNVLQNLGSMDFKFIFSQFKSFFLSDISKKVHQKPFKCDFWYYQSSTVLTLLFVIENKCYCMSLLSEHDLSLLFSFYFTLV